jgi:hypothetical protein
MVGVTTAQRVRELTAQLLTAEGPDQIQAVTAQLQLAMNEYIREARERNPVSQALLAESDT